MRADHWLLFDSVVRACRQGVRGHVLALLLTGMALAVRLALAPPQAGFQHLTFLPVVALTALLAGFWPGMLATLVAVVLDVLLFAAAGATFSQVSVGSLVFLFDGLVVCLSIEVLHRDRQLSHDEVQALRVTQASFEAISQQLRESSQYNASIVNNIRDGIVTIDEHGKVLTFTPSASQIFGYEAVEVVGKNIKMLMPQPYRDAHDGYLANYRETGVARIIGIGREVEGQRKDGSCFPMDLAVTAMNLPDGVRYVGLVRDITARKEMEAQLIAARDAAEAASMAKAQFLANMSHEIRTPMNAILGLTRLVLESDLRPEQREQLSKVKKSGAALMRIINDILDLSRLEAGRLKIERIPVRPEALIIEVTDLFAAQAEEKGLELCIDIAPDTPLVALGDNLRLTQVLYNLVGNAIKFTDHGEVCISVCVEQFRQSSFILGITIRDTGMGITREQQAKLFQSFSQADESITRTHGGSGLGLSIVKGLVELMGGHIAMESEPGHGTTVRLGIEMGVVPEDTRDVAQMGQDLHRMKGKRVLVVDDVQSSRHILLRLLRAWGVVAAEADSGPKALALVAQAQREQQPFHALLLDWRMPGMDGLEVARQVKVMNKGDGLVSPLNVLMMTAYDKQTLLQDPDAVHVNGVLTKPVVPSHLFDALLHGEARLAQWHDSQVEQRFDGLRVLLVEDNDLNQEVAASFLSRRGVQVTLADHGQDAVDKVRQQHFDLVLMDLHMPVMGGVEATRQILQLPNGQALPVVAMTAAVMQEDRLSCKAVGMVDFVSKPIEPEDLIRVLRMHASPGTVVAAPEPLLRGAGGDPVLDLVRGLHRLDGDAALQQRLLVSFLERHVHFTDELGTLLAAQRTEEAMDLVHSLKGIAGNLGAMALAQACARLIDEMRAHEPLKSLGSLGAMLEATCLQMNDALANRMQTRAVADPAASPEPVTPESLADTLRTLEPLVVGHDVLPDVLHTRLQSLGDSAQPWAARVRQLQHHLTHFEHNQALEALRYLQDECGEGP